MLLSKRIPIISIKTLQVTSTIHSVYIFYSWIILTSIQAKIFQSWFMIAVIQRFMFFFEWMRESNSIKINTKEFINSSQREQYDEYANNC